MNFISCIHVQVQMYNYASCKNWGKLMTHSTYSLCNYLCNKIVRLDFSLCCFSDFSVRSTVRKNTFVYRDDIQKLYNHIIK